MLLGMCLLKEQGIEVFREFVWKENRLKSLNKHY